MPGDTRIHFVRHAETLFNVNGQLQGWCDSPLTERGERQAAALGEWMSEVPLAAAFMSDLTRTRTTAAAALSAHPDVVPHPMRELREWNFGSLEGQPNDDLWIPVFASMGLDHSSPTTSWAALGTGGLDSLIDAIHNYDPRADSAADVRARLTSGLAVVAAAAEDAARAGAGDVLVVTHGAVLGSILGLIQPGYRVERGIPNCGIASVTWSAGGVVIGAIDGSCSQVDVTAAG